MTNTYYGHCIECGAAMRPIWHHEREYKYSDTFERIYAGRSRKTCLALECQKCKARKQVDERFDTNYE